MPSSPTTARRHDRLVLLICGLLLLAFGLIWFLNAGKPYELDYDEGVYLTSAQMVMRGHQPFTAVFSSQPPVFLNILVVAFHLFGSSVAVGRGVSIIFALLSLGSAAGIGWRLAGPIAAPVTIIAQGLPLVFFLDAQTVQSEMPALALALLAIALLLSAKQRRRSLWIAASGFIFALGLLCKLLVAPMILPLIFVLGRSFEKGEENVWRFLPANSSSARVFIFRFLLLVVGGIVACAIVLLPYDLTAVYDQAIRFHLKARAALPNSWPQNLRLLGSIFQLEPGLIALALAGLIVLFRERPRAGIWLSFWIAATTIFLIDHSPLFTHHSVILVPPLAIAAGASVLWLPSVWATKWIRPVALLLLLPLVALKPQLALGDPATWRPAFSPQRDLELSVEVASDSERERQVLQLIEQNTRPDDFIVSDRQMRIFRTGRNVPPAMVDTSGVRITSGYLTDAQAISASEQARMIIFWTGRLERLKEYRQWVQSRYRLLREWRDQGPGLKEVYLLEPPRPPQVEVSRKGAKKRKT
ncbi:MAG: glycosyltransferase family 39 protein [Pyrinomonadaceae bacterium]